MVIKPLLSKWNQDSTEQCTFDQLKYIKTFTVEEFKEFFNSSYVRIQKHGSGVLYFIAENIADWGVVGGKGVPRNPLISLVSDSQGRQFYILHDKDNLLTQLRLETAKYRDKLIPNECVRNRAELISEYADLLCANNPEQAKFVEKMLQERLNSHESNRSNFYFNNADFTCPSCGKQLSIYKADTRKTRTSLKHVGTEFHGRIIERKYQEKYVNIRYCPKCARRKDTARKIGLIILYIIIPLAVAVWSISQPGRGIGSFIGAFFGTMFLSMAFHGVWNWISLEAFDLEHAKKCNAIAPISYSDLS